MRREKTDQAIWEATGRKAQSDERQTTSRVERGRYAQDVSLGVCRDRLERQVDNRLGNTFQDAREPAGFGRKVSDLQLGETELSDASARLTRAAHWTRRQFELGFDVIAVHQEAAIADQRVAETWRSALAGRESAVRELLRPLSRDLRAGLSAAAALDLYVALTLPQVYRTLVVERGWSLDPYERWLATALNQELLGPLDNSARLS